MKFYIIISLVITSVVAGILGGDPWIADSLLMTKARPSGNSRAQNRTLSVNKVKGTLKAVAVAGGVNLQTFSGNLRGAFADPITPTDDPVRPFAVGQDTFTDIKSAQDRSCNNQKNACSKIANGGTQGALEVKDCDTQLANCLATKLQASLPPPSQSQDLTSTSASVMPTRPATIQAPPPPQATTQVAPLTPPPSAMTQAAAHLPPPLPPPPPSPAATKAAPPPVSALPAFTQAPASKPAPQLQAPVAAAPNQIVKSVDANFFYLCDV